MKQIWIDGYEANVPQRLGSGQVAFELLKNLEKLDKRNAYTILLPKEPMPDLPKAREGWSYKVLNPKFLWTRIALPYALYRAKQKPDVIFSPTHYGPYFSPVKRVVTIFDLSYLHFPQFFLKQDLYKLTNWTHDSIQKADQIITISHSAKRDIRKYYKKDQKKIHVSYPGYNSDLFRPISDPDGLKEVQQKYGIDKPYVLFIGTVQPRKNLKRLIEAFVKIDNVKLVVVGKIRGEGRQGWMYEEIVNLPNELNIKDKIIFTGYVPNNEMLYLLNGAEAFALPSLWEGFGIPVVDAMACGLPVIVSNTSSLPEVAGKAGIYVDPQSVTQIEHAIRLISADPKLRRKLSKLALEQAKKFSWKKMAREVLKVLESI
jgi:glycosyltransferase involved in cell wall biosynthesis